MANEKSIIFKPSNSVFKPSEKWTERERFDTSFAKAKNAIGNLRLPAVNNGRYESKHPIMDSNDNLVGYLSGAVSFIGYTWDCVYAANCFWLTNMTFSDTMGGVNRSNVTLVDEVGTYLFSSTRKFKAIKSFDFEGHWAGSTKAFKLLDNERELFYLSSYGFCLFNTYNRERISHVNFPRYVSEHAFDFAISPKVKILAIAGSSMGEKDPIDGEYRYKNFIWLYNLESGILMGEENLDTDTYNRWSIHFSEDGRNIKISSEGATYQFELATK
ncbi:MAG: hypothetical protein R2824_04470 [Saprospiraceae bacterium]|nr:hypothetical protein [Lewinella sp.]